MKTFSPKNKVYYLAGVLLVIATIVFTMGFLMSKASACVQDCQSELCQSGETLLEFNYNSKPQSVFIDESTQNLADQLCECGPLGVDTSDGLPHYIYLTWDNLGDFSTYNNVLAFDLLLNHEEVSSIIKVELKNELGDWIEVCDPVERNNFTWDTCDLSSYFDTLKQLSSIELRIVAEIAGACHAYLQCATLDVELYNCEPPAPFCGDGIKNNQEECDGQDGVPEHYTCTAQCTLEYVPYCGDQTCDENETCENCSQDCGECPAVEYCGLYFNHIPDGVEFEGPITGLFPGDNPFNHPAWWDILKLAFERNDSSLTFGNDFLPVDQGLDGDPFHFTVHWRATLNVSADGNYGYTLGSDDDAWMYVDDTIVEDLGGVHAPVTRNNSVFLTQGQHIFNLYFAERHTVQSYLSFNWTTPGIEVVAQCEPYCGDQICNGQETCETCVADCGECPPSGCQSNADCDDQNACTADVCDTGTGECMRADVTCFDQDPCTNDSCNPSSGCVFTPNDECVCDPEVELVINGSFEEPLVEAVQYWDIFNSSQIPGWDVEWVSLTPSEYNGYPRPLSAYLELQNDLLGWAPQEGRQYAELDSDWNDHVGDLSGEPASAKIYQDIQTIPGEEYIVSFWFSPRPQTTLDNNRLEFRWDGSVVADDITGAGDNTTFWTKYTYTLSATSNSTRIQFADIGLPSDSLGTFLDKVSVRCGTTEPEPYCGDGIKNNDEECDGTDGVSEHYTCTSQCVLEYVPYCGDNLVNQLSEECDDGNTTGGDGCSATCEEEELPPPYCGDQTCNGSEDCTTCAQDCGGCGGATNGGGGGGGGGGNPQPLPRPILTIDKSIAEAFVNPGSLATYTIIITNNGEGTAYNVVLADTLPVGFSYNDPTITGSWNLGHINPGESKTVTYQVLVSSTASAGNYLNTAQVNATNYSIIYDDAVVEVRIVAVLGEATTRLPETGGNPLFVSVIALFIAIGSGISIKRLIFSKK